MTHSTANSSHRPNVDVRRPPRRSTTSPAIRPRRRGRDAHDPGDAPPIRSSTWHAEEALLLLMSGGFFVHLISASRHLEDDGSQVGDILLWPVDGALFLIMAYCAIALTARSRQFARTYDMRSTTRILGYWAITAYVTLSLPGHVMFLLTGDTRFFDGFPWWFSLIIMPVYVLIVWYVLTLAPLNGVTPPARTGRLGDARGAAERWANHELSPARSEEGV